MLFLKSVFDIINIEILNANHEVCRIIGVQIESR